MRRRSLLAPASPRTKEAYEANIAGSQGQQYQRCRTWNLGIIDEAKRGWVLDEQDENGCRLTKNGNAGADGEPVLWGHPRLDGYYGGKSGGLYLNTDDNAGNGLFVGVSGGITAGASARRRGDRRLCRRRHAQVGEAGRYTRPSGPGPYVSGSAGARRPSPTGNGTTVDYFGNTFDRRAISSPDGRRCRKCRRARSSRRPRRCSTRTSPVRPEPRPGLCRRRREQPGGLH